MKKHIIFQFLLIYTSHELIISANVIENLHISAEENEKVKAFSSSDVTSSSKNCNVILNFSNMYLSHIGSNFISSPYIKNLTLQNNSITNINNGAFESLPNLEYLDISNNKLSLDTLFSFGGHQNLKVLILDYNCENSYCLPTVEKKSEDYPDYDVDKVSKKIPEPHQYDFHEYGYYIYTTTERTTTHGYRDYYEDGRSDGRLNLLNYYPKVEHLSLRRVNMNSFQRMGYNFPKLNYLDISQNYFNNPGIYNIVDQIPNTLTNLVIESTGLTAMNTQKFNALLFLNLNGNSFKTISSDYCYDETLCLQNSHNLLYLSISNCMITKIEVNAFKNTENLLELDISDNKIINIANETFDYMPSLKKLDLSRNSLSSLPDFSLLKNLFTLILNNVRNKTIFDSLEHFPYMPNLKIISLRHNNLNILPTEFLNNLPLLEEIDLSNNHIASLPPWQSQSMLCNLYLNDNIISNIDDLSLTDAKSLQILELKNNPVRIIKIESLKSISNNATLRL